ncbi:MAG: hypothetical protein ACJ8D5_04250 [Sphingomicrobium sp.]
MMFVFLLMVVEALASIGLAALLGRQRPRWPKARIVLLAPLPLPLLILGPCAYVIGDAALAPPEQCGVDACGMAMMAGMFGAAVALLLYFLGIGLTAVTVRARKEERVEEVRDVFS